MFLLIHQSIFLILIDELCTPLNSFQKPTPFSHFFFQQTISLILFFFWFYLFIFFLFNFFSFSKTKNRGDATTLIGWLFLSTLICKWHLKVLIYISTCGDYNSISIFFFFKFLLVSRVEASINGYLHCNSWFFLCVLFLLCSFEVE